MGIKRDIWARLQDRELSMAKESPVGVFSYPGLRGAAICGNVIDRVLSGGTCLDIGCGTLPEPYYMSIAESVSFVGIDPYDVDVDRTFDFVLGEAEDLPFDDEAFDGVLFATSLDHVYDPIDAISEARRVLKDGGCCIVWTGLVKDDKKYKSWKERFPAQYNENHLWAFTEKDFENMFKGAFSLYEKMKIAGSGFIYVYKKVR